MPVVSPKQAGGLCPAAVGSVAVPSVCVATVAAVPSRFLQFLNEIEANLPAGPDVHLIMDNYATHKVDKVQA